MRYTILLILLNVSFLATAQINATEGGLFSQVFSKEITEYRVKQFIIDELLDLPNKQVVEVEIDALTASASGELTTVVYYCKELNKKGLVFGFWNPYVNDFNLRYKGYAFKHFDYNVAIELITNLEKVLEEKKSIISLDNNQGLSKNAIYKFGDVSFIFYKSDIGSNLIRVLWSGFDSEWNQSNLKAMNRRMKRFLDNK
jgi:hypothetical protein